MLLNPKTPFILIIILIIILTIIILIIPVLILFLTNATSVILDLPQQIFWAATWKHTVEKKFQKCNQREFSSAALSDCNSFTLLLVLILLSRTKYWPQWQYWYQSRFSSLSSYSFLSFFQILIRKIILVLIINPIHIFMARSLDTRDATAPNPFDQQQQQQQQEPVLIFSPTPASPPLLSIEKWAQRAEYEGAAEKRSHFTNLSLLPVAASCAVHWWATLGGGKVAGWPHLQMADAPYPPIWAIK